MDIDYNNVNMKLLVKQTLFYYQTVNELWNDDLQECLSRTNCEANTNKLFAAGGNRMKKKKLLPFLLTLCMVFGLMPVTVLAESQETVKYIERSWDGSKVVETEKSCTDYELLHSTNSSWYTVGQEGRTTWYVAKGNITMNGTTLTVRGDVRIILCDGADVRIKDGIEVKTDYSLTIYGQAGDSGRLYAVNNSGDAGIGCGPNSGVGHITIHGGVIEAHGGKYAAGIGSGDERQMGSHITIFGGDIKAYGGDYGAGIGSGDETGGENGYIDIYGGKIYAKGGKDGAGIGGGNEGNGRHITIWGGEIEAVAGGGTSGEASGIGGGDDGGGGYITIHGGEVTATGKDDGPGIGGDSNCGTIIINGGTITARGTEGGAGIGGALGENLVKGSITINGGEVTASSRKTALIEELHTAEYGSAGIGSGGGDITGGGDLKVPITINGGNVRATGSAGSAGIGTGNGGDVYGQITITGGYVDAYANSKKAGGAGIGSGDNGDVKTKIIISGENGGKVIAQASNVDGAQAIGIGSSYFSSAGVDLYEVAKVTAGSSFSNATLKTTDQRLSGLKEKYARIELCEPHNITYTGYDQGHFEKCEYCGYSVLEGHIFNDSDVCVCGWNKMDTPVWISFFEKEQMYPETLVYDYSIPVTLGMNYTLPQPINSFDRYRFDGWKIDGRTEVVQPGYILKNVTKSIEITAQYVECCKISFDSNHGAGDMPDEWAAKGEKYLLPECTYTYSGGKEFSGWSVNDEVKQPGEEITVTGDTVLTANWGYPSHAHDNIDFTALTDYGYLQDTPGNYYLISDTMLSQTIDKSGTYNVCLNGHELYITDSYNGLAGLTVPDGVTLNIFDDTGDGLITILENYVNDKTDTPAITVESGGIVNFYGGEITGINSRCEKGGAVYVRNGGTFNMYGGRITGNSAAGLGGGVYVENGGTFSVSGKVKVTDNYGSDDKASNVYLEDGAVITVLDDLDGLIDVSAAADRETAVTSGLKEYGTLDNVLSFDSNYLIALNEEGEAYLGKAVTVTLVPGDESAAGTIDTVSVVTGCEYALPACVFTAPEGKEFKGWLAGEELKQPGDTITVTADTAVTAFWESQKPGDDVCPKDDTCPMTPFKDTDKSAWYHDGVHWALQNEVMNGTGNNTFEPMTATTRAMIVTMLWRMEGRPLVNYQMSFKDVQDDQWYTEAIRWAASTGFVNGYDEETFGTNDSVTREQLAAILYRSAQAKGQGFHDGWAFQLQFDDANQISDWADEAMHWMVMNGVMNGVSEKELSPGSDAVRAQVATMLMRFSEKVS